jgi:hypothetical protein
MRSITSFPYQICSRLAVHVEDLALVEAEAFHDVLIGVCVQRLLEGLPKQVLPAFRIGDVAVDREHEVVGHERVGGHKEAEIALYDGALVGGEPARVLPGRDVARCGEPACWRGRDFSPFRPVPG